MNSNNKYIEILNDTFRDNIEIEVPTLRKDKIFTVKKIKEGLHVSNLGNFPVLPWEVFELAIECMEFEGGTAIKGNAMNGKLGDNLLPLNSVEGYIASRYYNIEEGRSVFRRISPIANILIYCGICENSKGYLRLIGI